MFDSAMQEFAGSDAEQLLSVIEDCERQVAALQARQIAAVAALAQVRAGTALADFAADEIGFVLMLSPHAARERMQMACNLAQRLPDTLAALGRGELDYYRAQCVAGVLGDAAPEVAATVQARVLPRAGEQSATQLKASLRRALLRADPAGAQTRHEKARAGRSVRLRAEEDGMGVLAVSAPADDALCVYTALDGLARAARARPGETRTLDQLRADTLAGIARDILAAGSWGGLALPRRRHRAHLQVTVGADTLLGVSDDPGWLAGYGPIPACMARTIARDATWRRVLTDPVTGSLLDYATRAHDPGAVVEGHVLARDATCVHPTCTVPAAGCDLDHTVAHPRGPTSPANLGPACRHHHRAKQAGFALAQPHPGVFVWTSPTGRRLARRPPPLATPRPDYISRLRPGHPTSSTHRPPGHGTAGTTGFRVGRQRAKTSSRYAA